MLVICDNCGHAIYVKRVNVQPETAKDTNVLNNDTISRQAAIDAAETYEFDDMFHMPVYREMVSVEDLRKLPSVQTERKKGKWIEEPNCYYHCSECGCHYPSILGYMTYNYCPNCGSDLREEGESNG